MAVGEHPGDSIETPATGRHGRRPAADNGREEPVERSVREDEILTSREACELLKIGRTKLWELTRRNFLPAYRLGDGNRAELRYKRSELLAWLEQNRV